MRPRPSAAPCPSSQGPWRRGGYESAQYRDTPSAPRTHLPPDGAVAGACDAPTPPAVLPLCVNVLFRIRSHAFAAMRPAHGPKRVSLQNDPKKSKGMPPPSGAARGVFGDALHTGIDYGTPSGEPRQDHTRCAPRRGRPRRGHVFFKKGAKKCERKRKIGAGGPITGYGLPSPL